MKKTSIAFAPSTLIAASRTTGLCAFLAFAAVCDWVSGVEYNVPPDPLPSVVADGDVLNAYAGVDFPFNPPDLEIESGGTLNLHGGSLIGGVHGLPGSHVNIYDAYTDGGLFEGTVTVDGAGFHGFRTNNANVSILEGRVDIDADNTEIVLSGGSLDLFALGATTVDISGGEFQTFFLRDQARVVVHGGRYNPAKDHGGRTIGSDAELIFRGGDLTPDPPFPGWAPEGVFGHGLVGFVGSEFALDDVPIASTIGDPLDISERGVVLSGRLADGNLFEFPLEFASLTYRITVVPEPGAATLLSLAITSGGWSRARQTRAALRSPHRS